MESKQTRIQALAINDPKWSSFNDALPQVLQATETQLPHQLVEDVVGLLRTLRPELTAYIDSSTSSGMQKFGPDSQRKNPIPKILTIGAILFLLQTYVLVERPPEGGVHIKIESPSMADEMLVRIVEAINNILSLP